MVKNLPAVRETRVPSLGWEDPLEEGKETYTNSLAWRIPMERGAWQATVHGVVKSWTWLSTAQSEFWASQMALVAKNLPANAGDIRDTGLILGLGRSPGGGHGNPLQYSCLRNPMDRRTWQATAHGVAKNQTRPKLLSPAQVIHNTTSDPISLFSVAQYSPCIVCTSSSTCLFHWAASKNNVLTALPNFIFFCSDSFSTQQSADWFLKC